MRGADDRRRRVCLQGGAPRTIRHRADVASASVSRDRRWTGWSVFARLLPYLDQGAVYDNANFQLTYSNAINTTVAFQRIGLFLCPSDPNPQRNNSPFGQSAVTCYGFNYGDWYCWGGFDGPVGRNAFYPNRARHHSEFIDGTSHTMMAAEVKAFQQFRRCSGQFTTVNNPDIIPSPDIDSMAAAPEYATCTLGNDHGAWVDANAHETSVTTAWPPNHYSGDNVGHADLDLESTLISQGGPTYAAITARSYHENGVHALFADGHVRFVGNNIHGSIWRAVGTVAGGEVTGDF